LAGAGLLIAGCGGSAGKKASVAQGFDRTTVGSQATGWVAAETNGQGTPAVWRIIRDGFAPSPPHVMAVVSTQNTGQTYNLMIAESGTYRDLELSTSIRAVAGKEDQGGGVIWRAQDANNYYLARWNPLERNFRVYKVRHGQRQELASADVAINPRLWQRITIRHVGNRITATLNDEPPLVLEDSSLQNAGNIGLWTKADAASFFDEITVKGLD
jgi:hypothetical protein